MSTVTSQLLQTNLENCERHWVNSHLSESFSSGEEFLASQYVCETRCLILDVAMPGMSGPAVQQELMRRRKRIPIVFITAHSEEDVRPQLLQQGAVECLSKPFSDTALREALNAALQTK